MNAMAPCGASRRRCKPGNSIPPCTTAKLMLESAADEVRIPWQEKYTYSLSWTIVSTTHEILQSCADFRGKLGSSKEQDGCVGPGEQNLSPLAVNAVPTTPRWLWSVSFRRLQSLKRGDAIYNIRRIIKIHAPFPTIKIHRLYFHPWISMELSCRKFNSEMPIRGGVTMIDNT